MLLLELDLFIINEDGFFEKRISSSHREEDNVDWPGDKFHNDKLMREMTKVVLMIV